MVSTTLPILKLAPMDLRDQGSFAILDLSTYASIPVSSAIALQITAPGYQEVNVPFTPNSVNVYKCSDLGITCGPTECCALPDGIYDVKYTVLVTPGTTTTAAVTNMIDKTIIKIDQILCKFQNMFAKIDLECNCGADRQKEYKKQIKEIDLLIAGSVAAANSCDVALSAKLYQKADSMLDNICCAFGMSCTSTFSCPQCQ